jgi:transposase
VRAVWDRRERRWRHLDFAGMQVHLRYRLRRVDCERCGVITELVPWAEPQSRFTRDFEDTAALLLQSCDKTTVCELMRIAWETTGAIAQRVVARRGPSDLLEGLTHIGIDELSYRKGHYYLTVITDQRRARVVWVGMGRSKDTVGAFFAELGKERADKLEVVCLDMSPSYIEAMRKYAPSAVQIFDRFHVQRLAHDALDEVRRQQMRELRGTDEASDIKSTRWSLHKRPWNTSVADDERLSRVQQSNLPLYRAYLLKEMLADVLDRRQHHVARSLLQSWIGWAQRSRLPAFCKLARTISKHLDGIVEYVKTRMSNALAEGINSKIRVATKQAYGFRSPDSLKAMIHLRCSGVNIPRIRHLPHAA